MLLGGFDWRLASGHVVALTFAVAGAVGYGTASLLQSIGARRRTGTLNTVRDPAYLLGLGLDLAAWLASLVALRTLPIYQVQAILAGSLAVTVVAARVVLGVALRRIDAVAVVATVAALGVLAASSGPQPPVQLSLPVRLGVAGAAVVVAAVGWLASRVAPGTVTGALAGLAFGGAAVAARGISIPARPLHHPAATLGDLLGDPLLWALAVFGIGGNLLYAHALEHGTVGPVTALLWIVEVIAPSVVGVLLLGDTVRAGWVPAVAVAFVAALAAAAVLATAPAQQTTGSPGG